MRGGDRSHALALVLVTMCISAGCAPQLGEAPPDPPVILVETAHPLNRRLLDFGEVIVGEVGAQAVRVSNRGESPLTLSAVTASSPLLVVLPSWQPSALIQPGASVAVEVQFTPLRDADDTATLRFESDDPETPVDEIAVSLTGLAPRVVLTPPALSFPPVPPDCVVERELRISNAGRRPLDVRLVQAPEETAFSLIDAEDGADLVDGATLPPGAFWVGTARLGTTASEGMQDTVLLETNDPDAATQSLPVSAPSWDGLGTTDVFAQRDSLDTDVLWVIGKRGGLSGEMDLFDGAQAWVDAAEQHGNDWRAGVIRIDDSALAGPQPVVSAALSSPAGALQDDLAALGEDFGQGLFHSAWLALTPPLGEVGGANQGFRRDDAGLHIIFVAQVDDWSGPLGIGGPEEYLAELRALVPDPSELHISALTPVPDPQVNYEPTPRVLGLVSLAGGVDLDLYAADPLAPLADVGWRALHDRFPLSSTPLAEPELTLEELGGQPEPLLGGWSLEGGVIVFAAGSEPPLGSTVRARYVPADLCPE